jgi:predicted metal-dependent HD superfamily phosphohydrolase
MQSNMPMEQSVITLLKEDLPSHYYYHNYEHTLYVMQQADIIGRQENCSAEDLRLLRVAALWHDTGYVHVYSGHEEESCALAREDLPGYGFTETEIEKICGMIMATKVPQQPKNKLEEILADADLVYLGSEQVQELAHNLFEEVRAINPSLTKEQWNDIEIGFLQSHHFFTAYCRKYKEPVKELYLDSLISRRKAI